MVFSTSISIFLIVLQSAKQVSFRASGSKRIELLQHIVYTVAFTEQKLQHELKGLGLNGIAIGSIQTCRK